MESIVKRRIHVSPIGVTNGCAKHLESNAPLILINVRGMQMVAIKMNTANLEESALIIDAEKETMKKIEPVQNIARKTINVALVFVSLRLQNVPHVFHLAKVVTAIKNSKTLTNLVTVTRIVKREVTATKLKVKEIHVV